MWHIRNLLFSNNLPCSASRFISLQLVVSSRFNVGIKTWHKQIYLSQNDWSWSYKNANDPPSEQNNKRKTANLYIWSFSKQSLYSWISKRTQQPCIALLKFSSLADYAVTQLILLCANTRLPNTNPSGNVPPAPAIGAYTCMCLIPFPCCRLIPHGRTEASRHDVRLPVHQHKPLTHLREILLTQIPFELPQEREVFV